MANPYSCAQPSIAQSFSQNARCSLSWPQKNWKAEVKRETRGLIRSACPGIEYCQSGPNKYQKYQKYNKAVYKNNYQMPMIDTLIESLP